MQRIVKEDRSKAGGRVHLPPPRAVIGLEAEFSLIIDDVRQRPEKVFGTPQRLIRRKMLPRTGRSFQLPSGGAIYFDTGVIEVATPIVELEPGCCYRATASCGSRSTMSAKNCGDGRGGTNARPGCKASAPITTSRFKPSTPHRSATRNGWATCWRTFFPLR